MRVSVRRYALGIGHPLFGQSSPKNENIFLIKTIHTKSFCNTPIFIEIRKNQLFSGKFVQNLGKENIFLFIKAFFRVYIQTKKYP